ncbi:MAG: ABC transporter substrate-binding protein, partial [Acidimicrobiales bacterium]
FTTDSPVGVYLARRLHATSVGVVAYGIAASSSDACASVANGLKKSGVKVGFEDLNFGLGASPTADVLQMKAHHVNLFFSCMEGSDNLDFDRAFHQNDMNLHSIWLTGYQRSLVTANPVAMQGVIYLIQHVPFEAVAQFPGKYAGMAKYLSVMRKYEPAWVYDETAIQGYINAEQFVQGLKTVAKKKETLTRANLISAINKQTNFTGGVTTPVNWTNAHTSAKPPYCSSFVEVEPGGVLKVVFAQKNNEVFVCSNKKNKQVSPLAGTPGL